MYVVMKWIIEGLASDVNRIKSYIQVSLSVHNENLKRLVSFNEGACR